MKQQNKIRIYGDKLDEVMVATIEILLDYKCNNPNNTKLFESIFVYYKKN